MARILILSLVFRPDNVSTAQLMADLASDLQAKGHLVTVLTTIPHYNPDEEAIAGQPMRCCWGRMLKRSSYRGVDVVHVWMPKKGRSKWYRIATWINFHIISSFAGVCKVPKPDVIFSPSPPLTIGISAWLLSIYYSVPFIYNVQEIYPDVAINLGAVRSKWLIKWLYQIEQFVYRKASAVSVISERMQRRLLQKGVPKEKLWLIPNFVDVREFTPSTRDNNLRHRLNLQDKFVVVYAGNIGRPQHLETLVYAAAILKERKRIQFVIIGDGSERQSLERQVASLSIGNVYFLSYQPYSMMPLVYAAADVCYVPQAVGTSDDGIPSKVYRIMASGRPVLACTDAESDLAELIINAKAGVVVTTAHGGAIAEVIDQALNDEVAWARMGLNGREHVLTNYDRKIVVANYETLINGLAKRAPQ